MSFLQEMRQAFLRLNISKILDDTKDSKEGLKAIAKVKMERSKNPERVAVLMDELRVSPEGFNSSSVVVLIRSLMLEESWGLRLLYAHLFLNFFPLRIGDLLYSYLVENLEGVRDTCLSYAHSHLEFTGLDWLPHVSTSTLTKNQLERFGDEGFVKALNQGWSIRRGQQVFHQEESAEPFTAWHEKHGFIYGDLLGGVYYSHDRIVLRKEPPPILAPVFSSVPSQKPNVVDATGASLFFECFPEGRCEQCGKVARTRPIILVEGEPLEDWCEECWSRFCDNCGEEFNPHPEPEVDDWYRHPISGDQWVCSPCLHEIMGEASDTSEPLTHNFGDILSEVD